MKRILIIFITAAMLLAGCNGNAAESSGASQEPLSNIPEESESPAQEPAEPEDAPFAEDEAFYRKVLLNYGGEMVNGVFHTAIVGLYFHDDWENAEDMPAGSFYTWRLCRMWNEDLPDEEKAEKYASPLGPDNGWFFSQEEYEALVREYFDVSIEHLRSDQKIYDAENKGYCSPGGMGIGEHPAIELIEVEAEDDLRRLHIALGYESGEERKILTIRIGSAGAYKFVSYRSVQKEITAEPMAAQGAPAAVTAIAFNKTADLTLNIGDTNRRAAVTTPAGGAVAYASSDANVATVDSTGNVTCKAAGKTVITATSGSVKASYNLTVTAAAASSAPGTPAASSSGGTGSGALIGYPVTVNNQTTPAATVGGFKSNGVYAMYFQSADGAIIGSISEDTYRKVLQAATDSGVLDGTTDSRIWMAQQFNLYRGLGFNVPDSTANKVDTDAYAQEVIRLVNEKREAVGLHALEIDDSLMAHAAIRAEELTIQFSHVRPNGTKETSECATMKCDTPSKAVQAWMNSDAHRTAILNESGQFNYNYIGAGCYQDEQGVLYWIITFSK